jgi:MFS family permease
VDRTRRHIALRLLPFLFILYITNYLDRTSVAYAAIGMSRDLGFSDRVFGLGAGIFFVSYVALQVPGALLVERWSARRMMSASMIAWGSGGLRFTRRNSDAPSGYVPCIIIPSSARSDAVALTSSPARSSSVDSSNLPDGSDDARACS